MCLCPNSTLHFQVVASSLQRNFLLFNIILFQGLLPTWSDKWTFFLSFTTVLLNCFFSLKELSSFVSSHWRNFLHLFTDLIRSIKSCFLSHTSLFLGSSSSFLNSCLETSFSTLFYFINFCKSEAGVALCIAETAQGAILDGMLTVRDVMGISNQHLGLGVYQHTLRKGNSGKLQMPLFHYL